MSLTYAEARDEILAVFKTAWDTTSYQAFYDDVRQQRGDTESPWASVHLRHASGGQATLSGETGSRTFARTGNITTQIFTPSGKGLQDAYALAKVVSDAFEGANTPGGAWFRNVRLNEVGRDGQFFQLNVIVDFSYDEIK